MPACALEALRQVWPAVIFDKLVKCYPGNFIIDCLNTLAASRYLFFFKCQLTFFLAQPMFFGQMVLQEYADDPALCFAAVADTGKTNKQVRLRRVSARAAVARRAGPLTPQPPQGRMSSVQAPLQITNFAKGSAIDTEITKIGLGGGGGAHGGCESYELMAWYLLNRVRFEGNRVRPVLFITGDELFYPTVMAYRLQTFIDPELQGSDDEDTKARPASRSSMCSLGIPG
jgi:hypothetical protein